MENVIEKHKPKVRMSQMQMRLSILQDASHRPSCEKAKSFTSGQKGGGGVSGGVVCKATPRYVNPPHTAEMPIEDLNGTPGLVVDLGLSKLRMGNALCKGKGWGR